MGGKKGGREGGRKRRGKKKAKKKSDEVGEEQRARGGRGRRTEGERKEKVAEVIGGARRWRRSGLDEEEKEVCVVSPCVWVSREKKDDGKFKKKHTHTRAQKVTPHPKYE